MSRSQPFSMRPVLVILAGILLLIVGVAIFFSFSSDSSTATTSLAPLPSAQLRMKSGASVTLKARVAIAAQVDARLLSGVAQTLGVLEEKGEIELRFYRIEQPVIDYKSPVEIGSLTVGKYEVRLEPTPAVSIGVYPISDFGTMLYEDGKSISIELGPALDRVLLMDFAATQVVLDAARDFVFRVQAASEGSLDLTVAKLQDLFVVSPEELTHDKIEILRYCVDGWTKEFSFEPVSILDVADGDQVFIRLRTANGLPAHRLALRVLNGKAKAVPYSTE